ncbi:hypothetical protein [Nocardioides speluncae]|uniref:hypothetical protein n=1 Tax=Nocardioides speluncae TaxID=2670337 RepID=UPI0012B18197|nr:hypothetical protein [Nocardioides speluncae]
MERLYRAGREEIPQEAEHIQTISRDLFDVIDIVNVQSARAGDPAILVDMLTIGGDLYDVLRDAVTSLNNCAAAVIATADDFRRTDEDAASDYDKMSDSLKGSQPLPVSAPPEIKDPEAEGATTVVGGDDGHVPPEEVEVESTPDPTKTPDEDKQDHEDAEAASDYDYQREQRSGR